MTHSPSAIAEFDDGPRIGRWCGCWMVSVPPQLENEDDDAARAGADASASSPPHAH